MIHSHLGRFCIFFRIIIPGDHVQIRCPAFVVQRFIRSHKVRRDLCIRDNLFDRLIFIPEVLQHTIGIKPFIIESNPLEHASVFLKMFAQQIRRYDFIPFIKSMAPETCIPRIV